VSWAIQYSCHRWPRTGASGRRSYPQGVCPRPRGTGNLAELPVAIHRPALFLELVVVLLYITMFCHLQWQLYASAMDQNVTYERKCSRRHTTRIRLIHAFSGDVRGGISVYYTRRGTVTGKDSDKCKRQFSSIRLRHSARNPCREMASDVCDFRVRSASERWQRIATGEP